MSTSNESSTVGAEPEWAAFVAIDWADQKHVWRMKVAGATAAEQGELENTPEAVDQWATRLCVRFGGRPIAVCLEQSHGAVVFMLAKYAHLVLYPVHPKTAADYRKAFYPSGTKNDPGDAELLLELLLCHRDRLRRLQPDTVGTRLLGVLVEQRRCLVNEKTRQKNRLTACLKMYFPQVLRWFDDVESPLVEDLLQRWNTLQALQKAHPGTLRRFFHEHNCRSAERLEERVKAIYAAVPATQDAAVLEGEALVALRWVVLLQTLREQIVVLDQRIAQLVQEHPEGALFASLPGAGPALVPRLLVAFGTQRDRYPTAYNMQCYSGIAPVTEQSGNTRWQHCRWACPGFLRQTFHEYASHSIARSAWARAFYQSQREDGKEHHAAVRALAFKWIRIIHRCWKDGKPYEEQTYLEALHQRGAPLAAGFKFATDSGWQPVAGFQKFSTLPS